MQRFRPGDVISTAFLNEVAQAIEDLQKKYAQQAAPKRKIPHVAMATHAEIKPYLAFTTVENQEDEPTALPLTRWAIDPTTDGRLYTNGPVHVPAPGSGSHSGVLAQPIEAYPVLIQCFNDPIKGQRYDPDSNGRAVSDANGRLLCLSDARVTVSEYNIDHNPAWFVGIDYTFQTDGGATDTCECNCVDDVSLASIAVSGCCNFLPAYKFNWAWCGEETFTFRGMQYDVVAGRHESAEIEIPCNEVDDIFFTLDPSNCSAGGVAINGRRVADPTDPVFTYVNLDWFDPLCENEFRLSFRDCDWCPEVRMPKRACLAPDVGGCICDESNWVCFVTVPGSGVGGSVVPGCEDYAGTFACHGITPTDFSPSHCWWTGIDEIDPASSWADDSGFGYPLVRIGTDTGGSGGGASCGVQIMLPTILGTEGTGFDAGNARWRKSAAVITGAGPFSPCCEFLADIEGDTIELTFVTGSDEAGSNACLPFPPSVRFERIN